MDGGMRVKHDHNAHAGSEKRTKFVSHPGIQDAVQRHERLKAEGRVIPRSPKGQRAARDILIEKWHARRKSGWNPEQGVCP